MTTSAANALHARHRARTLRRAGGRSVAVLGFAALTWAAFTGSAMALGGADQPADQTSGQTTASTAPVTETETKAPSIPLGNVVGSLTDGALRGLSKAAGAVTPDAVKPATAPAAPDRQVQPTTVAPVAAPARAATAPAEATDPVETSSARPRAGTAGSVGLAGLVGSAVHRLTTYAVPQSATADPATDAQAPAARPAPAPASSGGLSVPGLVAGVEDAVSDLGGTVLTATQLDHAVPTPHVKVLTNTLQALGVSDALPTVPLPQLPVDTAPVTGLPVVGAPVGDVLDSLPLGTSQSSPPVPTDPSGGAPVTTLPVPSAGTGVPAHLGHAASQQSGPTTTGALPVLPVLLPFEAFPDLGSIASPATFLSLADGGGNGTDHTDVHLSRALLHTSDSSAGDRDAGDRSIPLPTGPQSPAGGHDGGSGSGHQQGGQLTSFTLPGGGLVSLVREYGWRLPATPTSVPGFSPD